MTSIRIVLTVSEGCPELYAALDKIPPRLRAERVRALATIGVAAVGGGFVPADRLIVEKEVNDVAGAKKERGEPLTTKVEAVAKRLGGGL